jgi:hypothetical protein
MGVIDRKTGEEVPIDKLEEYNRKIIEDSGKYICPPKGLVEYTPRDIRFMLGGVKRTITPEQLVDLMWECGGSLAKMANVLHIKRNTILSWIKKDNSLHVLEEIDESWTDLAENVVNDKILEGSYQAATFRLETKGKRRGYFKKEEVTQTETIKVQLESGDDDTPPEPPQETPDHWQ